MHDRNLSGGNRYIRYVRDRIHRRQRARVISVSIIIRNIRSLVCICINSGVSLDTPGTRFQCLSRGISRSVISVLDT